jgi:hypothetical protein
MVYYGVGPVGWLLGGLWWLGMGIVLVQERTSRMSAEKELVPLVRAGPRPISSGGG